jgi:hypothetical protein
MGNGEPIAMDFKIGGFAGSNKVKLGFFQNALFELCGTFLRRESGTHYAGKSSTLKAAATIAHCAKEG